MFYTLDCILYPSYYTNKMKAGINHSIEQIESSIQEYWLKPGQKEAENSIVVLGKTGYGKSTLINFLAGSKLKAVATGFPPQLIIEAEENLGDIKIVSGGTSGTKAPDKYFDPQTGITYFDCPGFDDTRGVEQEVANAYYIQQVFQLAKKVKVVVVCKESEFQDRLNTFTELIKKITQLFPNITDAAKSMCLVISKASPTSRVEDFKDFLTSELQPQGALSSLNNPQQEFLESIIKDEGKILFFYAPQQSGPIQIQATEMIDAINALPYMQNPEVSLVISAEAKVVVSKWSQEVSQNIVTTLEEIGDLINRFYINYLDLNADIKLLNNKIVATKEHLNHVMRNHSEASIIANKILLLHNIDPTEKIATIDLQLTYINFIQQLQLNHQYDNISKGFYRILETVSGIESILTCKIQESLNNQIDSLAQSMTVKEQKIDSLAQSMTVKEQKIDSLSNQIELSAKEKDLIKQQVDNLIKSTAAKDQQIKDLLNRPPQIRIVESGGFCKIFHMHTKYDNPFLNLNSNEQKKILNETHLSFSQMLETIDLIKQEEPNFTIEQMFDIALTGQDTNLV